LKDSEHTSRFRWAPTPTSSAVDRIMDKIDEQLNTYSNNLIMPSSGGGNNTTRRSNGNSNTRNNNNNNSDVYINGGGSNGMFRYDLDNISDTSTTHLLGDNKRQGNNRKLDNELD